MITREMILAEAVTWVGTPWHRNQSLKGVGADCIGVIAGVALAVGLKVKYRNNYTQQPDGSLRVELDRQMLRVKDEQQMEPADVLLMSFGATPHHVALYMGSMEILHAFAQVRRCVLQPYDAHWRSKVRGIYRFRGVTE